VRLRSLNTISLFVIVACTGLLAGIPAVRLNLLPAGHPPFHPIDFVEEAERRGDDADAWLAALASHRLWGAPADDLPHIYERAATALPDSAAPHVLYASWLVRAIPRSLSEAPISGSGSVPSEQMPLTPSQREALIGAQTALQRAAALDPENAAIDYLRAYLALADRRNSSALDRLRAAMGKRRWELYHRDAAIAAYKVSRDLLPPLEASYAFQMTMDPLFSLSHFARSLSSMAALADSQGDHSRAIFLRESIMHLSRLMLGQGYTAVEGIMGAIIWSTVTEFDLSDEETEEIDSRVTQSASGGPGQLQSARNRAVKEAGQAKCAEYLRRHGRPELAAAVLSFTKQVESISWGQALHRDLGFDALLVGLSQAGGMVVAALVALLACGLAALLLRWMDRSVEPICYPRWAWVLLLSACCGLVLLEGFLRLAYAEYLVVLGLPLVLLIVLVVVTVHRWAASERQPVGFIGHYLGTLLALLLPLTALFCLIAATLAIPVALHGRRLSQANQTIISEGELAYYGLALESHSP
jgi:hypothetical protein